MENSTNDPQGSKKFKFETALEFLEQVKGQFSDRPDVYKEFLRIMKEFKGQEYENIYFNYIVIKLTKETN